MSDETPRPLIPLRIQAEEAHEELKLRHKVYPGRISKGYMTEAEARVGIDRMRAIRDTLRLFAEYETEVRSALRNAIEARKVLAESPLAQTVIEHFPGAAAVEVRDLSPEFMGPDSGDGMSLGVSADPSAVGSPAP
jgi:hypothetical protein